MWNNIDKQTDLISVWEFIIWKEKLPLEIFQENSIGLANNYMDLFNSSNVINHDLHKIYIMLL